MKIVVVVSPDKSDLYFANKLIGAVNVTAVVVENQTPEKDRSPLYRKAMKYVNRPTLFVKKVVEVLDRKFMEKRQVYNLSGNAVDFGHDGVRLEVNDQIDVLYTQGVNDINQPENLEWIRAQSPDVIAVCGASLFRRELISLPRLGVLNLHGGLSQFYRGLFTTDWAIHNGEPEYVGATVHFVSEGVDDGEVVYQGRPPLSVHDNPNRLYEKVVEMGVDMMIQAIDDLEQSRLTSTALPRRGKLYLHSMFSTKAKRRTWRQFQKGVVSEYLANKEARDKPVVEALINSWPEKGKV